MAFTSHNDLNILQAADTINVGAGEGNDTYVVTSSTMSAGQTINITDSDGQNSLKLVGGVTVVSSMFASNSVQLTLNNNSAINIFNADNFKYVLGGDPFSTISGTELDFSSFSQLFGVSTLPLSGAISGGENISVNDNGTITGVGNIINVSIGSNSTISGGNDAEIFYFDKLAALNTAANTQAVISQFNTEQDSLRINVTDDNTSISTLDQLQGSGIDVASNPITNSLLVNFGPDANGDVITLTLSGLTDPSAVNIELV